MGWIRTCGLTIAVAMLALGIAGQPAAGRPIAHASDMDCGDFPNQAAAQSYYISRGGPASDPDRLDGDHDGRACTSLPCPCAGQASPAPTPPADTTPAQPQTTPAPRKKAKTYLARIIAVTDGDTIRVRLSSGASRRVRLLGLDTPETKRPGTAVECGGPQATDSMVRLAFRRGRDTNADHLLDTGKGRGRAVTLVTDPTQDSTDRYGRLLAYARTDNNVELSATQIRRGWATTYIYANRPFQRATAYQAAERSAKAARRGVYGRCAGDFHRPQAKSASLAVASASYAAQLRPALAKLIRVGRAVASAVNHAKEKTDRQIQVQFGALTRRTRAARDAISGLTPPAGLRARQRALTKAITAAARDLGQISRAGRLHSPTLARRSAKRLVRDSATVRRDRRALQMAAGLGGS